MKYRILCLADDTWVVQERNGDDWWTVHHCELKCEQGYYEAKAWLKRKEAEQ